jgi:Fe-S-cluster containining protein
MIGVMPAYCLEIHSGYRCRHAGRCCTARWDIPIEADAAHAVELWFRGRSAERPFKPGGAPAGYAAVLSRRPDGRCVFFDRRPDGSCDVHRELGEERLPSACRHFPRIALTDSRGTFVTLSHYCPTAAELLFSGGILTTVQAPATLSLEGTIEGLNASDALPPLLRPGMLMDLDSYHAWEQAALRVLNDGRIHASDALDNIAAATARLEGWAPGGTPLIDAVHSAFCGGNSEEVRLEPALDEAGGGPPPVDGPDATAALWALALDAVPEGLPRPETISLTERGFRDAACVLDEHDAVVRAYLSARLFGNWMAYYGRGLSDVVWYLRTHRAVLQVEVARRRAECAERRALLLEAIRAADLLMVHLAGIGRLARLLRELEAGSWKLGASRKLEAGSSKP